MSLRRVGRLGAAFAAAIVVGAFALTGTLEHGARPDFAEAALEAAVETGPDADRRVQYERHLARSPRDGRAWVLLARLELADDRFREAADAYAKALDVAPKVARDPQVWCEYADALGMAQGGVLAGRPRELIARALELDAAHRTALEMAGSAAYEAHEYASAARYWRQLLALLDAGSAAHSELAAAVARAERRGLAANEILTQVDATFAEP
jgi:cytochrome c-type biogenesis protein CcmH/NrfG